METEILRVQKIVKITGLSISTIRKLEIAGEFPSRVLIGAKAVGWLKSDIEEWFNTRTKIYGGKSGL